MRGKILPAESGDAVTSSAGWAARRSFPPCPLLSLDAFVEEKGKKDSSLGFVTSDFYSSLIDSVVNWGLIV